MALLGPVVSARLEHGERRALFEEAAARSYTAPNGEQARLSWRTIENWYYAYEAEGPCGLEPRPRADRGLGRGSSDDVAERILALRRENPRRSIRVLIKMMVRARKVIASSLTRSSVARLAAVSERLARAVLQDIRRSVKREHGLASVAVLHGGVVTVVQPNRSDLGLYVHVHCLVTDGALEEKGDDPTFRAAPRPTPERMTAILARVHDTIAVAAGDDDLDLDPSLAACVRASRTSAFRPLGDFVF